MYLQSGKAYFAVWFPADWLSVREMFALGWLARARRLTKVGRAAFDAPSLARDLRRHGTVM